MPEPTIEYPLRLGEDRWCWLRLPKEFTPADLERVIRMLRMLVIPAEEDPV